MKMTNNDCLAMFNGLNAVKQPAFKDIADLKDKDEYLFHTKFVHRLTKNKKALDPIIEALREAEKLSDEYKEYIDKRDEMMAKYARKDRDGNPEERIIVGPDGLGRRSYNVPSLADKTSEASLAIDKLEKKYKDVIDARKKQEEAMQDLMKEETDFVPLMIPWKLLPKGLSEVAMSGIIYMIEDEIEEEEEEVPVKTEKKKP